VQVNSYLSKEPRFDEKKMFALYFDGFMIWIYGENLKKTE